MSRLSRTAVVILGLATAWMLVSAFPNLDAADEGKLSMETVAYKGWKNNLRLSNGDAELIITLDIGPRVISYRLREGQNVFKEYADQLGKSGEDGWQIRGGHRFWIAPEDLTRTYALDNSAVSYDAMEGGGVRITPPADKPYGIQKQLDISLAPSGSQVKVVHRVTNVGTEPTELSPWGVSVMAPGGVEIIPLPPHRPHPGPTRNAKSPKDYAPSFQLAVWPYLDFKDPRWTFGSKYLLLAQDAKKGPTKLGISLSMQWAAYLNHGTLFVKRMPYDETKPYPDGGVSFETFTNEDMLEMESLAPLVTLKPGEKVEHVETWELLPCDGAVKTEDDVDRLVLPKVTGK